MVNRMRRLPHWGLAALAAALVAMSAVAAGCGGGSGTSSGDTGEAATPSKGGTLQIADTSEAITLDPTTAIDNPSIHVLTQIMEPLFRASADGKIEPWLVAGTKQSSDHRTWTFQLRPGVKFSNGRPLTAEDVVFSLDAARKSANWGSMYEAITDVEASSKSTVMVTTDKVVVGLPAELSLFGSAIVPKGYGGMTQKEFGQHPIGTGPFKFASWDRGQSLTLTRNPGYWRKGEPYLSQVVFDSVPDVNSRTTQLRGGELDVMASPDWSQLSGLEGTSGLHVGVYALGYLDFLALNQRTPLFGDKRVREAANLALDRDGILEAALHGYGETAGSWIQPPIEFHDASIKPVAQDVTKAKSLLAEAVEDTGVQPKLTLLFFSGDTYYNTVAQVVQQDLEAVGFKVELQSLDESTVISQISAGKYDAVLLYYSSDIVDPSEGGSIYVGTEAAFTGGPTAKVEKLTAEAGAELNEGKRRQLYYEVQREIAAEQGVLTYDYRPFVWAMQGDVTGFQVNATGIPWLGETGFSE